MAGNSAPTKELAFIALTLEGILWSGVGTVMAAMRTVQEGSFRIPSGGGKQFNPYYGARVQGLKVSRKFCNQASPYSHGSDADGAGRVVIRIQVSGSRSSNQEQLLRGSV